MLCDEYKDALTEAAAGADAPASLREHLDACARCRGTLAAQQTLFTVIDAGLRSRANVGAPANFDHRVRAALEMQASQKVTRYSSPFVLGSMATAAAVAIAILLMHNANQNGKERTTDAVEQAEMSVSHPAAVRGDSEELKPSSREVRNDRSTGLHARQRSNGAAAGNKNVEVLVPGGQEELLVKYMEGITVRRPRVVISASLQHEADMKPVEVSPVEISALVVKPLADLSAK